MSLKKRKEKKSVLCAQCMLAWPAVHSFKHRLFNTSCSQEIMCKGVCYTRWHRRNCSHHVPPNVGFTLNITGIKPTVCPIYLFIYLFLVKIRKHTFYSELFLFCWTVNRKRLAKWIILRSQVLPSPLNSNYLSLIWNFARILLTFLSRLCVYLHLCVKHSSFTDKNKQA